MLIAKNTFIQMSKLTNVKGRINYISSPVRQENLYAVYETTERRFWRELAKCNQEEFKKSGTDGQCIEARELIIALPKCYELQNPETVLARMTKLMKKNYGIECISALHHNKWKTNYHIHLIFAERKLLDEPVVKIATRNMFYNEKGKHVRTKKEILDADGKVRIECEIIPKGKVYEQKLFTKKDGRFKSKEFLNEIKELYIQEINPLVMDNKDMLKVFDRNSPYLATKKIGKNNPRAEQMKADNLIREKWNQAVDHGYLVGVEEGMMKSVKREHILKKIKEMVNGERYIPGLFRMIIENAIEVLQLLVQFVWQEKEIQKEEDTETKAVAEALGQEHKSEFAEDLDRAMLDESTPDKVDVDNVVEVASQNEKVLPPVKTYLVNKLDSLEKLRSELEVLERTIGNLVREQRALQNQIANLKGLFNGKQKNAYQSSLEKVEQQLSQCRARMTSHLSRDGYGNAKDFMEEYQMAEWENERYQIELERYLDYVYKYGGVDNTHKQDERASDVHGLYKGRSEEVQRGEYQHNRKRR